MTIPYISLHNYTNYSMLSALSSPKKIFQKAKELNMPSIGITDYGSFAGIWDCFNLYKSSGVKLIPGFTAYFVENIDDLDEKLKYIVLLARNANGYKNLLSLNRDGFDHSRLINKKTHSIISWDLLQKYSSDVICLTGCGNGIVAQSFVNKDFAKAEQDFKKLIDIFEDRLAAEVIASNVNKNETNITGKYNQQFVNFHTINLAKKYDVKIIPSSCSFYINKEDAETHDVQLSIGSFQPLYSNSRTKYTAHDYYIKNGEEIFKFFSRGFGEGFAKSICENTLFFDEMCEKPDWIDPAFTNPSKKELPSFPVKDEPKYKEYLEWLDKQPDNIKNKPEDSSYLYMLCMRGFEEKLAQKKVDINRKKEYLDRIHYEWEVFNDLGLNSYMLIVRDIIKHCNDNNIPVGPARGSAAGSLVNYFIGIHQVDSIKYGLVFERFHNRLKKGLSDIDTDFSKKYRHKVIEYILNKYGKEKFCLISNIINIKPKVYVKDVARSLQLGGDRRLAVELGLKIANTIPARDAPKTIEEACSKAPLFAEYANRYKELIKYKDIVNTPRSFGTHAAGVIISERPLKEIVPLRKDKDGNIVVEYHKDTAEEAGLVKIDILGIETLDIIDDTEKLIKSRGKTINFDVEEYDKKTYDLISAGKTFGVFQFGTSAGTIDLCKKFKPKSIEDLSAITAIARPVSKDIREDFIKTKDGKKKISFTHPMLKNSLSKTYGYSIYDESLLILAKDIAGWQLDNADKLRKLTKEKGKNPEKVKKWREEFIEGAVNNNIKQEDAIEIWEKIIVPFGGYGFCKSHAVGYSFTTYYTAYLKAHFPIEFLIANLMSELNSGNIKLARPKIDIIKKELKEYGVKILPPDLNQSIYDYKLINDNTLLSGFGGIRDLGDEAIEEIISKRPFKSFFDFMNRTDSSKMRSSCVQALAGVGALDQFKISRRDIFLYVSDYRTRMRNWLKTHDPEKEEFIYNWSLVEKGSWSLKDLYAIEQHFYGEGFICNKIKAYEPFFNGVYVNISKCKDLPDRTKIPSFKCIVKDLFELTVKKANSKLYGRNFWKCLVEDAEGNQVNLTIFPDQLDDLKGKIKQKYKDKLELGIGWSLHCATSVNIYEEEFGMILDTTYAFMPPLQLPSDMKIKKTISVSKKDKNKSNIIEVDKDIKNELSELEDELFDAGLIQPTDEEFFD